MEQSIEYIRGALQSLVWDKGKEKEKEAADEVSMILQFCKELRVCCNVNIEAISKSAALRPTYLILC